MFLEYKEKFCSTPYWNKAFEVAYEVKDQELSTKEISVVSFLKAIEYITSKPISKEEVVMFQERMQFSEEQINDIDYILAKEYCNANNIVEDHIDVVCMAFQAGRISAREECEEELIIKKE